MKRLLVIISFIPYLAIAQTSDQHLKMANELSAQKNFKAAIPEFTKAIELNSNNVKAYLYRGNAFSNSNQYDEAVNDYSKVVTIDPGNANAFYYRA
ncbi:MAG: tetratricopeptide repeat protein, partial [Mucilaginibacter sp.]